jgi:uncharacterized protein YqfA (UPF0365 family)
VLATVVTVPMIVGAIGVCGSVAFVEFRLGLRLRREAVASVVEPAVQRARIGLNGGGDILEGSVR